MIVWILFSCEKLWPWSTITIVVNGDNFQGCSAKEDLIFIVKTFFNLFSAHFYQLFPTLPFDIALLYWGMMMSAKLFPRKTNKSASVELNVKLLWMLLMEIAWPKGKAWCCHPISMNLGRLARKSSIKSLNLRCFCFNQIKHQGLLSLRCVSPRSWFSKERPFYSWWKAPWFVRLSAFHSIVCGEENVLWIFGCRDSKWNERERVGNE